MAKFKTGDQVQMFRKPSQRGMVKDVVEKPDGSLYLVSWVGGYKVQGFTFPETWEGEAVLVKAVRKR